MNYPLRRRSRPSRLHRLVPLDAAIVALALGGAVGAAHATQFDVCASGCTYKTIQSAVTAAVSGDVIRIHAGRYLENVTISGKALQLVGDDNATTVVDGNFRGSVFTLGNGEAGNSSRVSMSQLTITHGKAAQSGGGIRVIAGASLTMSGVIVIHNRAGYSGAGIYFNTPQGPTNTLNYCAIDNNGSPFTSGGGIEIDGGTVDLEGSVVTRNSVLYAGGGIAIWNGRLIINNSSIVDNSATLVHQPGGDAGRGAGLLSGGQAVTISGSIIGRNTSAGAGGGVDLDGSVSVTISNSVIARNRATGVGVGSGAGGIGTLSAAPGAAINLTDVYIVQNQGAVGGIETTIPITSAHTTIKDNVPNDCQGTGCPVGTE